MIRTVILVLIAYCGAWGQEFEVASIKTSAPPGGGPMYVDCTPDAAFLTCQNMSLANLAGMAYGINYYQLAAPDWMRNARFDINAKVPEGATREQRNVMLQNLLAERFKLVVHHEMRDFRKYDLVVAKNGPKLKEAGEPPNDDGPALGNTPRLGDDGFPVLPRGQPGMIGINNRSRWFQPQCTIEKLAGRLSLEMRTPVTDATGLKGKYDIGLYWVSDHGALADADSGPTLMQAVQDQLGLRLESKKGLVDFLVVDHMEKLPTEN